MAVVSGGILKCRPFSEKGALCGDRTFLPHKVGGRISVRRCNSSNNNDGSVHSDNNNVWEKRTRKEDFILPSHIEKRRTMRWWLPLFGWSQADQERWADDGISESKTEAMDKSSADDDKEKGEAPAKRSKFVRGRLTPEKAKLLRKNLRETSTFHDIMYHSAIASRLASSDKECKDFEKQGLEKAASIKA